MPEPGPTARAERAEVALGRALAERDAALESCDLADQARDNWRDAATESAERCSVLRERLLGLAADILADPFASSYLRREARGAIKFNP